MLKSTALLLLIFSFLLFLGACGSDSTPADFQENQPAQFELTEVTKGYGAVDNAWNSIDGDGLNDRMNKVINANKDDFEIFATGFADLLEDPDLPIENLLRWDLSGMTKDLIDTEPRIETNKPGDTVFLNNPELHMKEFYAFLDKLENEGVKVPEDYLSGIVLKLLSYLMAEIPTTDQNQPDKAWLHQKAGELIEDIEDEDFREDFMDLSEVLCKITLQGDASIRIRPDGTPVNTDENTSENATNLEIGNTVKGTQDLLIWINKIYQNEETRLLLHQAIEGLADIFDPSPQAQLGEKLQQLVINLEDHFTSGGAIYSSDEIYSGSTNEIYSDAELGQTLREFFPLLAQLFMRSDRPNAIISTPSDTPPVYPLDLTINNLRAIGFDPDTIDVEGSLDDLARLDIWGRDRVTDSQAWPTSFLESLLFLTQATSHHGWQDGGDTAEVDRNADPRDVHGHGRYSEDLTLNDSLFSIKTHKTLNLLGVYDIGLKAGDGNHIYRSRTPFTLGEVDELHNGSVSGNDRDYRFFFDQNYGVLQFLAGPGAGDLGASEGGNPKGASLSSNQYLAYAPNGLHETQLSAWTMGWGVRACFGGEGPYYYADPNAETIMIEGETYKKYLRPDGKVYALVNSDGSRYLYPTEEGDEEDSDTQVLSFNNRHQRANRYMAQWQSDFFISHFAAGPNAPDRFFTLARDEGDSALQEISDQADASAESLSYSELIAENDPERACASAEEAFFRNYQWVMNEKKMVLIIPMYLNLSIAGKAAVYQILECHGWSGLANMRKFRGNHVWAKKNTRGASNLPGDYRMEVVTAATPLVALLVNDASVYNDTLDCGNATPSIVGHNLAALYRLAFPRSPAMSREGGVNDYVLGSQDFEVGDAVWEHRNAFVPVLFSLLAGLREYTPAADGEERPGINAGMRTFLNLVPILIKPLFYYHHQGAAPDPEHTWIPRVYGQNVSGDYTGNPFLQSSAEFYNGTPDEWFGSWQEIRHYQPANLKTILNVMIDSDLNDPQRRCDGILPLLLQTRALSNLLKLLMVPEVGTPPLEDWMASLKVTQGELTAINSLPESNKSMVYPPWMFAEGVIESMDAYGAYTEYDNVRTEDMVLDDLFDWLIGHDYINEAYPGFGIAEYPDNKTTEEDWQDFYDDVDTIADLLHSDSPWSITSNLNSLLDRIFAGDDLYTPEEIRGFLYGAGKLFGYFDPSSNKWIYQGTPEYETLYNIIALRLPAIHKNFTNQERSTPSIQANESNGLPLGSNYYSLLFLFSQFSETDGLLQFLLNTTHTSENWETTLHDLDRFLKGDDIAGDQSELWPTIVSLLRDMAKATAESKDDVILDNIYEDYGFQIN